MQVLAVDDDEIALDLMTNVLSSAGYEVLSATNGHDALRVLEQADCRLVISDWDMPDISGVDLCRTLRRADRCGYLYFVLLTARNSPAETVEGLVHLYDATEKKEEANKWQAELAKHQVLDPEAKK